MQCFKKNMKSERRAIKKYSYALCCQSYECFIIITPMTLWLTSPSVVQCMILACNQSRLLVKRLGTKMFLKPEFFFLRKQRYNTVRNGSRARIIYTSGSVELRVSNPLIAWTTVQVFLMFRILNINSYLALVPSPSQQIRPESEWPCLVCNFLSSSCSRQWVPITEYVLVLKHLFKEDRTQTFRETSAARAVRNEVAARDGSSDQIYNCERRRARECSISVSTSQTESSRFSTADSS